MQLCNFDFYLKILLAKSKASSSYLESMYIVSARAGSPLKLARLSEKSAPKMLSSSDKMLTKEIKL